MRGFLHLVRRQLASDRSVPIAIALVVVLLTTVATAAPRLLTDASDRQAAHDIKAAGGAYLDMRAVVTTAYLVTQLSMPETGDHNPSGLPGELLPLWGPLEAGLWALRDSQPEPLRSILGDPRYFVRGKQVQVETSPESDVRRSTLLFITDPSFAEMVELIEGQWPAPPAYQSWQEPMEFQFSGERPEGLRPDEILLHTDVAERLQWGIGEVRTAGTAGPVLLAGTYRPLDPEDTYWSHVPYARDLYLEDDPNAGLLSTSAAFLHPAWGTETPTSYGFPDSSEARVTLWFPVSRVAPSAAEVETVVSQAAGFTSTIQPIGWRIDQPLSAQFSSDLADVLSGSHSRITLATTLLLLLAIGPSLVAGCVLLLATRLLVERRRVALEQLSARGGSPQQLGLAAATEAVALTLPPALAGAVMGLAVSPGQVRVIDALPAALVATVPVLLLALLTARVARDAGERARSDLGTRPRGRRIAEATTAVIAVAVLAMAAQAWLGDAPADRWVAVAAPVAAMALAILLVLALYPAPVRAAERAAARTDRLIPFIALARARRAPAGGVVPVVALVVGIAVTVMATVLATTVDRGGQAARWQQVGADIRVSGPIITDGAALALASIDGVAAVARAGVIPGLDADFDGVAAPTTFVELAALSEVQREAIGLAVLPPSETGPRLLAGAEAPVPGNGVTLGDMRVEVAPVDGVIGGLRLNDSAVIADAADLPAYGTYVWRPLLALIAVEPGADLDAVVAEVQAVLPNGLIETMEGAGANFVASPLGGALGATVLGSIALAGLLVAAVLLLVQLLDAPGRARLIAVLRTLGLAPREGRRIAAVELMPLAVMSLVAGIVVGLAVPHLVLATSDLRPVTGGALVPPVMPDPLVLGAVLGGLCLLVVLAVLGAAWFAGRASIGSELRTVDA